MRNRKLSKTYKVLYDYIIGDLLSQVCKDIRFCVKSKDTPYLIGEKFEEYREQALKKCLKIDWTDINWHPVFVGL